MGKMKVPLHHIVTVEHEVEIDDKCPECGHEFSDYESMPLDEDSDHELLADVFHCNQLLYALKDGNGVDWHLQEGYYEQEYVERWCCPKCKKELAQSELIDFTTFGLRKAPLVLLELIQMYVRRAAALREKAGEDAAKAKS